MASHVPDQYTPLFEPLTPGVGSPRRICPPQLLLDQHSLVLRKTAIWHIPRNAVSAPQPARRNAKPPPDPFFKLPLSLPSIPHHQ